MGSRHWTNRRQSLQRSRGQTREVARECQLPRARREILDLAERFDAEPLLGIDEPHLPARGKPILVSAIYFADGTLATALSPLRPQVDRRSLRRSSVPALRISSTQL